MSSPTYAALFKNELATTRIALNLGCGEYPLVPPFVNLDRRKPDAVTEKFLFKKHNLTEPLPYPSDFVDYIVCHHCLEHLSYAEGEILLDECFRVLRKGGTMTLVVPDFEYLVTQYRKSPETLKTWADLMLFCEGPDGDKHRSAWDHTLITRLAWGAGFKVDRETPTEEIPNLVAIVDWQTGIICQKA